MGHAQDWTTQRVPMIDHHLKPDWGSLSDRLDETACSEAARESRLWAIEVLRRFFGDDWVGRFHAATGGLPEFLACAASHPVALIQVLEWAARIQAAETLSGAAVLQRHLRQDLVEHRILHTALQMEIAALAASGIDVPAFETRTRGRWPVDVTIAHRGGSIPIEAFVLTIDQRMRNGFRSDDAVSRWMSRLRVEYDVKFDGELRSPLADDALDHWLHQLEGCARQVAATGVPIHLENEHSSIRVAPTHRSGGGRFSGPVRHGRGWDRTEDRLRRKAEQARLSGARWLRLDMRDGLWQVSNWSALPFVARTDNIAAATAEAVAGLGLDGLVISSGACQVQGEYIAQSRRAETHLGLARKLDEFRARETVIVPLTERGFAEAPAWYQMYEAEPSWLDDALHRAGRPRLSAIVAAGTP